MMRVARAGHLTIGVLLVLVVSSLLLRFWVGFAISLVLLLVAAFFYRDPKRVIVTNANQILSPADGTIVKIVNGYHTPHYEQPVCMVRIFLSLFDVHINRSPIRGVINDSQYFPGKHLVAFHEKASLDNERLYLLFTNSRTEVGVLHIAGLIARRIVTYKDVRSKLMQGEIYGMIKLGSCVEVYLEPNVSVTVQEGDSVRAGRSVIGELTD